MNSSSNGESAARRGSWTRGDWLEGSKRSVFRFLFHRSSAKMSRKPHTCRILQLVALHFPPENLNKKEPPAITPTSPFAGVTRLGETIRSRSAKDLWRSAVAHVDPDIERGESKAGLCEPESCFFG